MNEWNSSIDGGLRSCFASSAKLTIQASYIKIVFLYSWERRFLQDTKMQIIN